MASDTQGSSSELRISDLHGAVQKESPDVYVTFRLGNEHAETPVIKNAGETLRWSEPISVTAGATGKNSDTLIVRAYDKKPLLPDALLGEARINLSEQSLGDSTVAGSGGGAHVQVQLLGKRDKFGGELSFTLTGTEGLSVPGGTTWGPQEVHDTKGAGLAAGAVGAGAAGGLAAGRSSSAAGDHGSTGFQGGGATAYPAQESGKGLTGEHMSDFDKNTAGEHGTTGFGGGGATARPAEEAGRDLKGERLSDFDSNKEQGQHSSVIEKLQTAIGFGPNDSIVTDKGAQGKTATQGAGGTTQDQPTMTERIMGAVGMGGAAASTTGGQGETGALSKGPAAGDTSAGYAAERGSATTQDKPSMTERLMGAVGMGGASTTTGQNVSSNEGGQGQAGYAGQTQSTTQGEGLAEKFKSAVGLGSSQGPNQTRGDVATAPGAAPGAAYTTAGSTATAGAVAAGSSGSGVGGYDAGATGGHDDMQSEEQRKGALYLAAGAAGIAHEGGLDSAKGPGGGSGTGIGGAGMGGSSGGGITTTETATGPDIADQMTPGATATDAGMMPDTGITTSYTSGPDTGTGGMGSSGIGELGERGVSARDYMGTGAAAGAGGVATLRQGGVDTQHEGMEHGRTGELRHGNPDPLTVEGQGMGATAGSTTGTTTGSATGVGPGGPAPGTTISAKDLASDSVRRDWAAAENAPLAGDTVSAARQPLPPTAHSSGTGASAAGGEGALTVSGIRAQVARKEDLLGHVTPYLVFEVGRHSESTPTNKAGIKSGGELSWDTELQVELDGGADAELHITAYDKKKLLPDVRLGEATASLAQLPRGRSARLNLVDHKTFGNIAGHVDFVLAGGGSGGEGAGNDSGMVEGAPGLSPAEHEAAAARGGTGGDGSAAGPESF